METGLKQVWNQGRIPVDVWRFDEAGRAVEFTEYYDTAQLAACCQVG
jgi:hypothetical protein